MAYTRFESKSSHMTKYSQPLKLVLFNILKAVLNAIKAHTTHIY